MGRREEFLRKLALNEEAVLESVLGKGLEDPSRSLGDKTRALARLAALIALDSAPASYQWGVAAAHASGATDDEIVGVLAAVSPIVGAARTAAAAPELAAAIGEAIDLPRSS